ncbi:hypothetical protein JHK85_035917 [Glycine max]|nr:hypothetical protein JHK85_035917 [Glycine max]
MDANLLLPHRHPHPSTSSTTPMTFSKQTMTLMTLTRLTGPFLNLVKCHGGSILRSVLVSSKLKRERVGASSTKLSNLSTSLSNYPPDKTATLTKLNSFISLTSHHLQASSK